MNGTDLIFPPPIRRARAILVHNIFLVETKREVVVLTLFVEKVVMISSFQIIQFP